MPPDAWRFSPRSINSSRRLEREGQRNVEVVWLTGRLMPDFKTIADFREDNGLAIRQVCVSFIELCREMKLFSDAVVAIDGSKFKAVNNRDRNWDCRGISVGSFAKSEPASRASALSR